LFKSDDINRCASSGYTALIICAVPVAKVR